MSKGRSALGGHCRAAWRLPGARGAALAPLAAAAIGASGIEQDSPTQHLGTDLARQALGLEAVLVTGDERTALAGAFAPGKRASA